MYADGLLVPSVYIDPGLLFRDVEITSIGPIETEVRDRIAEFRDREGYDNYNEALKSLLRRAESE